jgi:hypothetical protein
MIAKRPMTASPAKIVDATLLRRSQVLAALSLGPVMAAVN